MDWEVLRRGLTRAERGVASGEEVLFVGGLTRSRPMKEVSS